MRASPQRQALVHRKQQAFALQLRQLVERAQLIAPPLLLQRRR
jgi:hypothetical protein